MANQRGETTSIGHFWNRCVDTVNNLFETISFWTSSKDVEFADGNNAETKLGAIKGITSDFNTTDAGYAASMTAVSELNSSLNDKVSDIYVGDDGKLHKIQGGADTVIPFSGSGEYVGFYTFDGGTVNFTPDKDFNWMVIALNPSIMQPTTTDGKTTWHTTNAIIINKDFTFVSTHQTTVTPTKNGNTYTWKYQYKSSVVLLK